MLSRKNVFRHQNAKWHSRILKKLANIVELKHFDVHKDIRIVCDASHNGLGAVLEQLSDEGLTDFFCVAILKRRRKTLFNK